METLLARKKKNEKEEKAWRLFSEVQACFILCFLEKDENIHKYVEIQGEISSPSTTSLQILELNISKWMGMPICQSTR